MEITINGSEVADTIAAAVEQETGKYCETSTNEAGSVVVIYNRTSVIARITPLSSVMDVEPVGGLFDGEITEIPSEARTVDGIRELAKAIDQAISHVLNATIHH